MEVLGRSIQRYVSWKKRENKKEVVMQEGKPNKKMYFITDAGREEFYQYMQTDVEKDVLRSDF